MTTHPLTNDLRPQFLEAMSRMAASVSVLTTDGPGGPAGLTISSLTSVSADGRAPSILACIHHQSPAAAAIMANRVFSANVLRHDQAHISDRFSGRHGAKGADKFEGIDIEVGDTGAARIKRAAVTFDCRVVTALLWETHHLFVGEVVSVTLPDPVDAPLIYAARGYRKLLQEE